MMQPTNASDADARRRSALADRIAALPSAHLCMVEIAVTQAEATVPAVPGAQRVVAGATITERPDLVRAAADPRVVAVGAITGKPERLYAAGGTIQAPEPDHPAELAKSGPAVR